jgi:fructose/tagatose bisphosphate aldolase
MAEGKSTEKTASERNIDKLIESAVFAPDENARDEARRTIRKQAEEKGIFPASIQALYDAAGRGEYHNITVPAINIRGLTYHVARAVFRTALRHKAGAFIFEIARSEMGYTRQRPAEYAACILAAAIKEGHRGPVFIQGDHFQFNQKRYSQSPETELQNIQQLVREAVAAGFLNIDIDASTLVDISKPSLEEQQEKNCELTAAMTKFIREIQPDGVVISVGGEIGEVGKKNSTVAELKAFMEGYLSRLDAGMKGISKISVQTGTSHGGVVLPDGSIAKVSLDFDTLKELSRVAREEYGMSGAVQHGASTLPNDAFDMFPQVGTAEVHLATGFQNIIYDSPHFPDKLRETVYQHILRHYAEERKPDDTDEQFIYKTRKKAFGDFKEEVWNMPESNLSQIGAELEDQFSLLFQKLNVVNTSELVSRYISR